MSQTIAAALLAMVAIALYTGLFYAVTGDLALSVLAGLAFADLRELVLSACRWLTTSMRSRREATK